MNAQTLAERRHFTNLRRLIEDSAPLPKATIRWGARRLPPDNLAELDASVARRDGRGEAPSGVDERLQAAYDSFTPEQKAALHYIVSKMGQSQVIELEALVGRNEKLLRQSR